MYHWVRGTVRSEIHIENSTLATRVARIPLALRVVESSSRSRIAQGMNPVTKVRVRTGRPHS
jgi:hypothetical protein